MGNLRDVTRPMYYIQNYTKVLNTFQKGGISRFLSADYVGSAEFEFGAVSASIRYLRSHKIKLFTYITKTKGSIEREIEIYVVTTKEGFDRFVKTIDIHLDSTRTCSTSKEYTGILRTFTKDVQALESYDLWLDVSGFIPSSFRGDDAKETDSPPVAFTWDEELARRLYMELNNNDTVEAARKNLHIRDEVFTFKRKEPGKVCGLNADRTISVKYKYKNVNKFDERDVWPSELAKDILGM